MCCFHKKTEAERNVDDREIIDRNAKSVETLKVLGGETYKAKLGELQEKLKYLIPSTNKDVIRCDEKISDKLDDIKIALNKSGDAQSQKVDDCLQSVYITIAERGTKL